MDVLLFFLLQIQTRQLNNNGVENYVFQCNNDSRLFSMELLASNLNQLISFHFSNKLPIFISPF